MHFFLEKGTPLPCPRYNRYASPSRPLHHHHFIIVWLTAAFLLWSSLLVSFSPPSPSMHADRQVGWRATAASDPLYVLNAASLSDATSVPKDAFLEGFYAALHASGSIGADNRRIVVVEPESLEDPIGNVIEAALTKYPGLMAMIGPLSDTLLLDATAYTSEKVPSLSAIGPYTFYHGVRTWGLGKYFLRADPLAELFALGSYIIEHLHFQRIGVMHLSSGLHTSDYEELKSSLYTMHQMTPIEYVRPASEESLDEERFEAFIAQRPQAVIVYAAVSQHTTDFVMACLQHDGTKDIPMFFSSSGYRVMTTLFDNLPQQNLNFYFSSTNLLPGESATYLHMQAFEKEIKSYFLSQNEGEDTEAAYNTLTRGIRGGLVVYGWITGKVMVDALSFSPAVASREKFQQYLFNQKMYTVAEDVVIGTFATTCTPYQELQNAMCHCNQGSHTVNVYRISTRSDVPALQAVYGFSKDNCYTAQSDLPFYAQLLLQRMSFREASVLALDSISKGYAESTSVNNGREEIKLGQIVIDHPEPGVKAITLYELDYLVDVIAGPVEGVRSFAPGKQYIIFDPMDTYPVPRLALPNVIYLMPTLDQQVYLYAKMAAEKKLTLTVLVRSSPEAESITRIAHLGAEVAGIDVVVHDINTNAKFTDDVGSLLLLIGLQQKTPKTIRSMLEQRRSLSIAVLFEEFSLYYDDFLSAFQNASHDVQNRMLFATNLPLWTEAARPFYSTSFPTMAKFHERFDDTPSLKTPLALQAWYTAGVLPVILSGQYGFVTTTLVECFYRYTSYSFGSMNFGQFFWKDDCKDDDPTCLNYGARNISVLSMLRVLTTSFSSSAETASNGASTISAGDDDTNSFLRRGVLYGPVDVYPSEPSGSPYNMNFILATIIPFFAAFSVGTILCLYIFCWKRGRDNSTAPTNPEKPVTLMFTDIQSSTSLWAQFPEQMVEALDTHHRIIREQIKKLKCYEVKTIGDSFMIASEDAAAVVRLAAEIQKALYAHDWGTDCFDKFYLKSEFEVEQEAVRQKEREEAEELPGVLSGGELVHSESKASHITNVEVELPANYDESWCGLRVRSGIHTGLCDIKFDEVTKGYDYYGDTVNTAARTESTACGGQILMTQSTWEELHETASSEFMDSLTVKEAGAHLLRGVPHPVQMYQLDVFPDRVFKVTKRLDSDSDSDMDEDGTESGSTTQVSRCRNIISEMVYKVLSGVLSPFPTKKRVEQVKPLLTKWRISTKYHAEPGEAKEDDLELKYHTLLVRLCNKTSKVIQQREVFSDTASGGTNRNISNGEFSWIGSNHKAQGRRGTWNLTPMASQNQSVLLQRSANNSTPTASFREAVKAAASGNNGVRRQGSHFNYHEQPQLVAVQPFSSLESNGYGGGVGMIRRSGVFLPSEESTPRRSKAKGQGSSLRPLRREVPHDAAERIPLHITSDSNPLLDDDEEEEETGSGTTSSSFMPPSAFKRAGTKNILGQIHSNTTVPASATTHSGSDLQTHSPPTLRQSSSIHSVLSAETAAPPLTRALTNVNTEPPTTPAYHTLAEMQSYSPVKVNELPSSELSIATPVNAFPTGEKPARTPSERSNSSFGRRSGADTSRQQQVRDEFTASSSAPSPLRRSDGTMRSPGFSMLGSHHYHPSSTVLPQEAEEQQVLSVASPKKGGAGLTPCECDHEEGVRDVPGSSHSGWRAAVQQGNRFAGARERTTMAKASIDARVLLDDAEKTTTTTTRGGVSNDNPLGSSPLSSPKER